MIIEFICINFKSLGFRMSGKKAINEEISRSLCMLQYK